MPTAALFQPKTLVMSSEVVEPRIPNDPPIVQAAPTPKGSRYSSSLMVSVPAFFANEDANSLWRRRMLAFLQEMEREDRNHPRLWYRNTSSPRRSTRIMVSELLEREGLAMAMHSLGSLQYWNHDQIATSHLVNLFYLQMVRVMYKHLNAQRECELLVWLDRRYRNRLISYLQRHDPTMVKVIETAWQASSVLDWAPSLGPVPLRHSDDEYFVMYTELLDEQHCSLEFSEETNYRLNHVFSMFHPNRDIEELSMWSRQVAKNDVILTLYSNFMLTYHQYVHRKKLKHLYFEGAENEIYFLFRTHFKHRSFMTTD